MGKGGKDKSCRSLVSPGITLELPRYDDVQVIPGAWDDTARFAFSAGHCHSFAMALHDRTGWPILAMSGKYSGYTNLQHMVVVMPDGKWLDARGIQEPDRENHIHFQPMTLQEIQSMKDLKGWKKPQMEVAQEFVDAFLAEHQISH